MWRHTLDLTDRHYALDKAIEFINAGRMTATIGIDTVTETAEKFHTFLTAGQESGTPSGTSSAPGSTPKPSKVTQPPESPVHF